MLSLDLSLVYIYDGVSNRFEKSQPVSQNSSKDSETLGPASTALTFELGVFKLKT